jgi:hypothetical protein
MRYLYGFGAGTMLDTLKNVGTPELEWLFKSAADSGVTVPDLIASIICDAYDDEKGENP